MEFLREKPFTHGISLAFSGVGVVSPGGKASMRFNFKLAGAALTLILTGSAILPLRVWPQATTEASKRKVRTKVVPDYPDLAKQMNVTGKVKIEATITADGHVSATRVVGGSPLLVNAALEALRKWRYEPAPKETTEVVEFEFGPQQQQ